MLKRTRMAKCMEITKYKQILNLYWNIFCNRMNVIILYIIGLRLIMGSRDKIIADKLMYIPNNDTQIHPFCRLQLVVETFVHST